MLIPAHVCNYSDNIGGSSSPWLVLEYLPNGDLKSFLMVCINNCSVCERYIISIAIA